MEPENVVQSIEKLVRAAQIPISTGNGEPLMIVREGHGLQSIQQFLDAPRRIDKHVHFSRLDSFCAYVKEFRNPGTRLFVNTGGNTRAVLDFHQPAAPAWCDHTAEFAPQLTEEWKRWHHKNAQTFDQKSFALFLEDNALDINTPPAAEVLDVSRTLSAKLTVNFKKGVRLEDGTELLHFDETVDAKAGQKGELSIPSSFTLMIPVFDGRPLRALEAKLRYSIREGTLTFHYALVRPHKLLQWEIESIVSDIKSTLDMQPLYGSDV